MYPEIERVINLKTNDISKDNTAIVYKITIHYEGGKKQLFLKGQGNNDKNNRANYQRNIDAGYEYSILKDQLKKI